MWRGRKKDFRSDNSPGLQRFKEEVSRTLDEIVVGDINKRNFTFDQVLQSALGSDVGFSSLSEEERKVFAEILKEEFDIDLNDLPRPEKIYSTETPEFPGESILVEVFPTESHPICLRIYHVSSGKVFSLGPKSLPYEKEIIVA